MWRALMPLLAIFLISGCTRAPDVGTINDYVKTVNDATSSFDAIAADFAASCLADRELRLTRVRDLRLAPDLQPSPDPTFEAGGIYNVSNDVVQCQSADAVSQQWAKRNLIIVGYVRSLGAIAGVDTKPSGFDALATQLNDIGAMKDAQAKPFADLATKIAAEIIAGKRDAELRRFVKAGDEPLQAAAQTLATFVTADYRVVLDSELVFLNSKFRTTLRTQLTSGRTDAITIYNERQEWISKRTLIGNRITAVDAYVGALRTIARTNGDMVKADERGESISDQIAIARNNLNPLAADISTLYNSFK